MQAATDVCQVSTNNCLCITDNNSGLRFLVDTGANVSVLPVVKFRNCASVNSEYKLYAANGTEIKTHGVKTLKLDFALRRPYTWTFILADISQAILGADFLSHHGLVVDLRSRKLIDKLTNFNSIACVVNVDQTTL